MTDPNLPADLGPARIAAHLETERYGRSLRVLVQTGSTMDDAAEAAAGDVPDGHVVVADTQQAGRGARGRRWSSPAGTDLYLSIVARRVPEGAQRPLIALATGLGVADAAEALTGARAQVKWPNDVRVHGKKCAGVLVETKTAGHRNGAVVLGIGLDVNRREWPDELAGEAISLAQARDDGADVNRTEALARVLRGVEQWVDRLVESGPRVIVDALDSRLALRGERVRCNGTEGVLEGVAPSGAARLRTDHGHQEVVAGTLRPVE